MYIGVKGKLENFRLESFIYWLLYVSWLSEMMAFWVLLFIASTKQRGTNVVSETQLTIIKITVSLTFINNVVGRLISAIFDTLTHELTSSVKKPRCRRTLFHRS